MMMNRFLVFPFCPPFCAALAFFASSDPCAGSETVSPLRVYIGTYTTGSHSEGIYSLAFDSVQGTLGEVSLAASLTDPSFLALGKDGQTLYVASELPAANGSPAVSGVESWRVSKDGRLARLNAVGVADSGPSTHVAVAPAGTAVFAVHYNAAWVTSFPVQADGSLGRPLEIIRQSGATGPNKDRQEAPHAHSLTLSPDGHYAYVCDLGLDEVVIYRVDAAGGLQQTGVARVSPGAGPRHSKVSADGRFLYVLNELDGSINVFGREAATGALDRRQKISTLRPEYRGPNGSAEIQIHPRGRFVYASNRGPDEITVFSRDETTGALTRVQNISTGGKHPRHFALSPDGSWLLCANRDTDNLVLFAVDSATGTLRQVAQRGGIPQPVCVLFAPMP